MCKELKLLNSYGELNKAIIAWAKTYLKEDKNIAHVAISRKAPRLLEWCKQHGVSSNVDIITELALPFENWSKYKDCILTDEAIYHGTTFSKVMTLVVEAMHRWSLGKAFPLFLTSDAMEVEGISNRLLEGCHLLASSDIPFFVDSIISKFFDLGKPYDIEYPLFYIDFKDELSDDTIELILGKLSEDQKYSYYKSSNYVRELNCYINNYTLRTDSFSENSKPGVSVPDFAKLRFFKRVIGFVLPLWCLIVSLIVIYAVILPYLMVHGVLYGIVSIHRQNKIQIVWKKTVGVLVRNIAIK